VPSWVVGMAPSTTHQRGQQGAHYVFPRLVNSMSATFTKANIPSSVQTPPINLPGSPSLSALLAQHEKCSALPITRPLPPENQNRAALNRRHLVTSFEHPHSHHSNLPQPPQGHTPSRVEQAVPTRTRAQFTKRDVTWLRSYPSSSVSWPSHDSAFPYSSILQDFGASLSLTWTPRDHTKLKQRRSSPRHPTYHRPK
jgi:hypothetical protein